MGVLTNIKTFKATGAGVMGETLAPGANFVLQSVLLHLNAASATVENFTITKDDVDGAAYDTLLYTKGMNTETDAVVLTLKDLSFEKGDELDFAWANTNTKTWGLEVQYRLQI